MLSGFIRMMGVYPPGSVVQLTDDRYAMVMQVNSSRPLKPRVLVHDPKVPRDEALLLDLEHSPTWASAAACSRPSCPRRRGLPVAAAARDLLLRRRCREPRRQLAEGGGGMTRALRRRPESVITVADLPGPGARCSTACRWPPGWWRWTTPPGGGRQRRGLPCWAPLWRTAGPAGRHAAGHARGPGLVGRARAAAAAPPGHLRSDTVLCGPDGRCCTWSAGSAAGRPDGAGAAICW
jgi:hypothetical protein